MPTEKEYYIPVTDAGKADLLDNFALKIPTYATALNITPGQVTSFQDDAAMFRYMLTMQEVTKTFKQDVTSYKNYLRDGEAGPPLSEPVPVFPTLPAPPTTVNKGVFDRFRRSVANIKSENAYTNGMGEDLGIVGDEETFNIHNMKPVLTSRLELGHPVIKWTKGHADSIDIYVDRNDGAGSVYLVNDTHPDYTDTTPLPAESAAWNYKAAYKIGDDQVGHFSDVMKVAVRAS